MFNKMSKDNYLGGLEFFNLLFISESGVPSNTVNKMLTEMFQDTYLGGLEFFNLLFIFPQLILSGLLAVLSRVESHDIVRHLLLKDGQLLTQTAHLSHWHRLLAANTNIHIMHGSHFIPTSTKRGNQLRFN
jgi:hypothetical protein